MRLSRYARAIPGHQTDGDTWPSWVPAGSRRRLDPLVRLAAAASERLIATGGPLHEDTAVIVSTAYGAVDSTFKFATSMATYGDSGASPTPFTTSVHNSCAAALGELLKLRGPSTTISHGAHGVINACSFASRLLATGRAPAALIIAGERHNEWSRRIVAELSRSPWPVGDGVVALLLEPGDGPGRTISFDEHKSDLVMTGGAVLEADRSALNTESTSSTVHAPDVLQAWWPGCAFAAISWNSPERITIREVEDRQVTQCWLGPHQ